MAVYYREYDPQVLKRLQIVELEMLKDIDAFCQRNGIEYFVHYGCAIGAVRHKGFIPWDDDIDLCMLRLDSERFIELARADKMFSKTYEVLSPPDDGYPNMFIKISKRGTVFQTSEMRQAGLCWGINIDIFPMDVVPEDLKASKRKSIITAFLAKLQFLYFFNDPHVPGGGLKAKVFSAGCYFAHYMLRAIPFIEPRRLQRWYLNICKKEQPTENAKYTVYSGLVDHDALKLPYEEFFPTIEMPFENTTIRMTKHYDKLLRIEYGDYLKIPPLEKRVNHAPEVLNFGDE